LEQGYERILISDQKTLQTSKETVLLVEDYEPNVLVAGTFLEDLGYNYEVARNGIEAIEKVKAREDYSFVLMDVQMPGMNGFEATQLIRELEKSAERGRLRIIGLTAHALAGDKERCLSVGMDAYLSKPFNLEDLKKTFEKLDN
jgi:CheY-like chemotaxis protein